MKIALFLSAWVLSVSCFAQEPFKIIHPADLESLQKSGAAFALYDANTESTRANVGLIPGAHALSSYDAYPKSELAPDASTPLIFYCANKMCTASHEAARRAATLGFKNVSVMVDGVFGWKQMGKPLAPYHSTAKPVAEAEISPAAAKLLMEKKHATLLDVREGEERFEVIAGAHWLPMSKLGSPEWKIFVNNLNKKNTVVVHCASGKRAKKVAETLSQEGFHTAYFQGPDQWKAAGLPVEKGPAK